MSKTAREDLLRYFPAFGANEHLVRKLVGMVEYIVEYGYYRPQARPDVESKNRSARIDLGTFSETQQLAGRAVNLWRRP